MQTKKLAALLCAMAATVLTAQTTFAVTKPIDYDIGGSTGIIATTPNTYGACTTTTTSDKITTTGVGSRQLIGQVIVQYVTDAGRVIVPNGFYSINQTGDLDLTVSYPPSSQWPTMQNGTKEIHVDIQIEVYENGFKVATIGPGIDWDVYCGGNTPPPPPQGGQGCTPGYWRQDQHFDSYPAPYTPNTTFYSVFGVGPNISLAAAAKAKGGGENALIRHATAALLNAASDQVSYDYSVSAVIQMVQQAYATGNFEQIKDLFAAQNELGCPLN